MSRGSIDSATAVEAALATLTQGLADAGHILGVGVAAIRAAADSAEADGVATLSLDSVRELLSHQELIGALRDAADALLHTRKATRRERALLREASDIANDAVGQLWIVALRAMRRHGYSFADVLNGGAPFPACPPTAAPRR